MNFTKLSLVAFYLFFLTSCTSIKVISAEKRAHYPGVPSGTSYVSYSISISIDTPFSIQKVSLLKDGKPKKYSIQNLKSLVYVNSNDSLYPKGWYKISFRNNDVSKIESEESIYINIISNKKTYTISRKLSLQKAFHSR